MSSNVKYVQYNVNGMTVFIPYIRLTNGQWIPFRDHDIYRSQPGPLIDTPVLPAKFYP